MSFLEVQGFHLLRHLLPKFLESRICAFKPTSKSKACVFVFSFFPILFFFFLLFSFPVLPGHGSSSSPASASQVVAGNTGTRHRAKLSFLVLCLSVSVFLNVPVSIVSTVINIYLNTSSLTSSDNSDTWCYQTYIYLK